MGRWIAFKPRGMFHFDAKSVKRRWATLHAGDCEPLPDDPDLLEAWAHFHSGRFEEACVLGLALGEHGATVANMAACVYARELPPQVEQRLGLCQAVSERVTRQLQAGPGSANAHFLHAQSMIIYSHGISVTQAMAQGLGRQIKLHLEHAIALEPRHADAHFALGAFHADMLDKLGPLIASMTMGARKETSQQMFEHGFGLLPRAPQGLLAFAHALPVLENASCTDQCTALLQEAAGHKPWDAPQHGIVAAAKKALAAEHSR